MLSRGEDYVTNLFEFHIPLSSSKIEISFIETNTIFLPLTFDTLIKTCLSLDSSLNRRAMIQRKHLACFFHFSHKGWRLIWCTCSVGYSYPTVLSWKAVRSICFAPAWEYNIWSQSSNIEWIESLMLNCCSITHHFILMGKRTQFGLRSYFMFKVCEIALEIIDFTNYVNKTTQKSIVTSAHHAFNLDSPDSHHYRHTTPYFTVIFLWIQTHF